MASNVYKAADPMLACPAAADGASITPSGVSNTFSAWAELTAAATEDWKLGAIIVRPGTFVSGNYYEVQIGVGGAGSESAVATVRGYEGTNSGGSGESGSVFQLAAPADVIATGQRVSARLKQVSTNTTEWRVAISYWALPLSADSVMPAATVGPVSEPASALISATTSASQNTYGSWVEVTSATDDTWAITDVIVHSTTNFLTFGLQIGLGAAASEVATWTVYTEQTWFAANAWEGGPWTIQLRPPFQVSAGVRVAVRVKCINASGAKTAGIGLSVVKGAVTGLATADQMAYSDYQLLTCGAGGWKANWSSWTEYIASTTTNIVVCQLTSSKDNTGLTWYQVGVGTAGNEEVVATVLAEHGVGFGGGRFNLTLPYGRWIPAGSRVSIRITVAGLSVGLGHYVALGYIVVPDDSPDFDNWTETDVVGEELYQGSGQVELSAVTGASAWQNGSWVEIDAALPEARVLIGGQISPQVVPAEWEFDFGIGGSGSEVAVHTVRTEATDVSSGTSFLWTMFAPPLVIPSGARLSWRARCSLSTARTIEANFLYAVEPVSPIPPEPTPPETTDEDIIWLRRMPTILSENKNVRLRRIEPMFAPGVGNANPPQDDPQCSLRVSFDGGNTWSSVRQAPIGLTGHFTQRTYYWQCGFGRRPVIEISGTANVRGFCCIGLDVEAEVMAR